MWFTAAVASLNNAALFLRHAGVHEFDERLATLAADIRQRGQEAEQKEALDEKEE